MKTSTANNLGQNIKHARKNLGLTQTQVAHYLGCNRNLISKIERGQSNITVSALEQLCDLFMCELDDIINGNASLAKFIKVDIRELDEQTVLALGKVGRVSRNLDKITTTHSLIK